MIAHAAFLTARFGDAIGIIDDELLRDELFLLAWRCCLPRSAVISIVSSNEFNHTTSDEVRCSTSHSVVDVLNRPPLSGTDGCSKPNARR